MRLTRLEHDARRVLWAADFRVSCVRLMASTEIGLAPRSVQELCAAVEQTLHLLRPAVPACVTDVQAVEAFMSRVTAAVVTILDTHVTDPSTRYQMRKTPRQACERRRSAVEGIRHERRGLLMPSRLDAQLRRLEAQPYRSRIK